MYSRILSSALNRKFSTKISIYLRNVENMHIHTDFYIAQNINHFSFFFFSRWPRDVSPCVSPHNFPRLRWRTYTFSQSRSFRSAFQWKLSVLLSRERRVFSGCRLWKWIKCTPRARKIIRPPYRQFRCYMIKYIANASGAMNRIIQKNISSA